MSALKPQTWVKVWFSAGSETTAGLVLDGDRVSRMTTSGISRLFPNYEETKMRRLHISHPCQTWEEAFLVPTTAGNVASARHGEGHQS